MLSKLLPILVVLLPLTIPVQAVTVAGWLGNACNGEELYEFDALAENTCTDVSGIEGAESITATSFNANEIVEFYSDTACTTQVGATQNADVCFLIPPTEGVQSFQSFQAA